MNEKMRELKDGPVNTAATFGDYLEQWLPYHVKAKPLEPTTAARYKTLSVHGAPPERHL
jgi:hypothetical protein